MSDMTFECEDVSDPDRMAIEATSSHGSFDIFPLRRDEACKLLVTIRGWLFATKDDAVRSDIYCDDEILN